MKCSHQGCISEILCGISFLKAWLLTKDFGLDCTAALLIFFLFNFWNNYEENVNVLISVSLFLICMAFIFKWPFHPLLYFFLIKYLLIYSAYNNAERRKHSHNTYVNFVLSLSQAMVLAISCLRTKRDRTSPCCVCAI